jgi:hypothetical protein
MKRIPGPFLVSWVAALLFALPQIAFSAATMRVSDSSPCLDGMETVPETDDLVPILIAADGGCIVVQTPISI